jgi:hypothetical protein
MLHHQFNGMSQKDLILSHCRTRPDHSISPHEARNLYRIERLAARVYDLEMDGVVFARDPREDATGRGYVRYTLASRLVAHEPRE